MSKPNLSKPISTRISKDIHRAIKKVAVQRNLNISDIVRETLEEKFTPQS